MYKYIICIIALTAIGNAQQKICSDSNGNLSVRKRCKAQEVMLTLAKLRADQGPRGLPGKDGQEGPRGPKGETGEKGPKGDKGDTGPAGPAGRDGKDGALGDAVKGPKGDTGPQGPAGAQGPKGDKGDQGIQGIQGPAGAQGPHGRGIDLNRCYPVKDEGRAGIDLEIPGNFIGMTSLSLQCKTGEVLLNFDCQSFPVDRSSVIFLEEDSVHCEFNFNHEISESVDSYVTTAQGTCCPI